MKETYVNVDGERLYFFVEKKPIKNINLKVNINKTVTISIPRRMSVARAKELREFHNPSTGIYRLIELLKENNK